MDSAVAALLLKQEGYDVHGFTFRMWSDDGRCCSRESVQSAIAVARSIGIPHTIVDIRAEFERKVVSYFLSEYQSGRTPNPCAVCNRAIRFGSFFKQVNAFGADYLSTGHYSKISSINGELFLTRAKDSAKTQEYFLSLIPAENLSRILFPLGDICKDEVRRIAEENNLPVESRESQDICFIPSGDTQDFLQKHLSAQAGDIVDVNGKVLGKHRGIWHYTIGQRKGLGISSEEALFVLAIDAANNRITVGPRAALKASSFRITDINRFTERSFSSLPLSCKIRYATPEVPCRIEGDRVILLEDINAITPGQLAVIYWQNKVVMAGIIALS